MINVEKLHLNKWDWWELYSLFLCNLKQCLYWMVKRRMKTRQPVLSAFLPPDSDFGHALYPLHKAKASDEGWKEESRRLGNDFGHVHTGRCRDIWAPSSTLTLELLVWGQLGDSGRRDTWAGWMHSVGRKGVSRCNLVIFVWPWAQTNKLRERTTSSHEMSRLLRYIASGPHPIKKAGVMLCPGVSVNVPISIIQFFILSRYVLKVACIWKSCLHSSLAWKSAYSTGICLL